MDYIALFFCGAFLCNCIPHLACGLRGEAFPTPFARPRGVGLSSPFLNFAWGLANLAAGAVILARHGVSTTTGPELLALVLGVIALGSYLSIHFGKVRQASTCPPNQGQA